MQGYLRQGTARTVRVGPFLDATDANTAKTALTIVQADVKLSKTGGAFAAKTATGGGTHDTGSPGWYAIDLDATDTATLGSLRLVVHVATALYVEASWTVLNANVYDVLFGSVAPSTHTAAAVQALVAAGPVGSVTGNVDGNVMGSVGFLTGYTAPPSAASIAVEVLAAAEAIPIHADLRLVNDLPITLYDRALGADASAAATQVVLAADESDQDNVFNGAVLELSEGTARQVVTVTDYDGGTRTATIDPPLAFALTAAGGYTLLGLVSTGGDGGGGDATAANQSAILGHLTDIKGTSWTDANSLQARLPNLDEPVSSPVSIASGGITAESFAANAITASALASNAAQEIAGEVETAILNEGDLRPVIAAIVDAIESNSETLTVNAIASAVRPEIDAALVAIHLDHLLAVADPGGAVATSSLWAKLSSKTSDFATFSSATDSLEGIFEAIGSLSPITATADAATLTTGTTIAGTYASTATDDDTRYTLAPVNPGGLSVQLSFTLGTGRLPTSVAVNGYFNGSGQTGTHVEAYNVQSGNWDRLSNSTTWMASRNNEQNYPYSLSRSHADPTTGVVQIRFVATSTTTSHRLYLDRVLVFHLTEAVVIGGSGGTTPQAVWEYPIRTLTNPSGGGEPVDVKASVVAALNQQGYSLTRADRLDYLDVAISTRSNYAGADPAGVTALLNKFPGVSYVAQTGDAFARIGIAGVGLTNLGDARLAHLDADVSSVAGGGDTPGTTTLLDRLTVERSEALDHLDADVSSRSTYDGSDTPGTTTLLDRLTVARSSYLDNLDIGGLVARQGEVQVTVLGGGMVALIAPSVVIKPESGARDYLIEVLTKDAAGALVAADSLPTIAVTDSALSSLITHLDSTTMTEIVPGYYRASYTLGFDDDLGQVLGTVNLALDGVASTFRFNFVIAEFGADVFTAADRSMIYAIHTLLPDAILSDLTTADIDTAIADAFLAAGITPTVMGRLDVSVSSRSTYDGSDTAGTTTLLARLTAGRAAAIDYLDVPSSSLSTYMGGPVASVTGDVGGKVLGGGLNALAGVGVRAEGPSGTALATATNLASIAAVTAKLDSLIEPDGLLYRYTTNALEQAPSGDGGGGNGNGNEILYPTGVIQEGSTAASLIVLFDDNFVPATNALTNLVARLPARGGASGRIETSTAANPSTLTLAPSLPVSPTADEAVEVIGVWADPGV